MLYTFASSEEDVSPTPAKINENPSGTLNINERVLSNPIVISHVISCLDLRSLAKVKFLSRLWLEEAEKEIQRRKTFLNVSYSYYPSWSYIDERTDLLIQRGLSGQSKKDLIDHVQMQLKNHLWSQPKFGFMFHTGPRPLMVSCMRSVKEHLPPNCQILGLLSRHGCIPTVKSVDNNSFVSVELQEEGQHGVTFSFWPCLKGVELTVFDKSSTLSEFIPREDKSHKKLKALFIFTTSYAVERARHDTYKQFNSVIEAFDAYERKIALAGVAVDAIHYESTCSSEKANETGVHNNDNVDGGDETTAAANAPSTSSHANGKSSQFKVRNPAMAGVAISGDHVKAACSIVFTNDLEAMEAQLIKFKQSLDFDADVLTEKKKTIGFLFTCSGRGNRLFQHINVETRVINKVFPQVHFSGIYGDGEYGENYWPKFHSDPSKKVPVTLNRKSGRWHFFSNVIALIHVEQE